MSKPEVIGARDPSIKYEDRLTVKALILNEKDEVLIINDGLLPGGGVENNEDNVTALRREILEEVGIAVSCIEKIETVVQYRDFLKKKYIISGYKALYADQTGRISPQDEGEARFTHSWYNREDAIQLLNRSISRIEETEILPNDTYQGKLFNLKTTKIFLDSLMKSS